METFDNVVTLIKEKIVGYDDEGNQKRETEELEIYCNESSVYSRDFYSANNIGLKPECVLSINCFEYDGQKKVVYKNQLFEVLRTYKRGNEIELTVGEKIGSEI